MSTDTIADLLTRIRNAQAVRKRVVEVPGSKLKLSIVKVLQDNGFIANHRFVEDDKQGIIKIALKYHPITKEPAIRSLSRVSRPGLRQYADVGSIPRVMNGMGVAILSTSKGVMTNKQAKAQNVGGEVLCYVQ